MYKLRDYQKKASDAAVKFLTENKDHKKNGLIVLPTGAGKSVVIADIANRIDDNILVFCPSREIVLQNYEKLIDTGFVFCSIFSASCGRKEVSKVTFATIGSVFRQPSFFKHFKYCLIDEAHLFNPADGMYKSFMRQVNLKSVGLTATPYRLYPTKTGGEIRFITRTRPRFFTNVIDVCQIADIQQQGFLAKMQYYLVKGIDISRLDINNSGNYTEKSIKKEYKRSGFLEKLCNVVERLLYNSTVKRRGILVFTQFVEEAENLCKNIHSCAIVTGETPNSERQIILDSFKAGKIRVVANVGVLTTGFDYPELDTVVLGRATRSLSLYYQMVGRAIRPHKDKKESWIIDLCGTVSRFGPVENLVVRNKITHPIGWCVETKSGRQLTNTIIG